MTKPQFITFTGVDGYTSMSKMLSLQKHFKIEWAILLSAENGQLIHEYRYPDPGTIEQYQLTLSSPNNPKTLLAGHLCGKWATEIATGQKSTIDPRIKLKLFSRVQINVPKGTVVDLVAVNKWAEKEGVIPVLQVKDAFPALDDSSKIQYLYDISGGKGISPSVWIPPYNQYELCGYAGGMNVTNVRKVVETIGTMSDNYWIDMETGVRDQSNRFSLMRCEDILNVVYGVREL